MKKIKTLLILTSFISLFLFQKTKANGPEVIDVFEYLEKNKKKINYEELIPKEEICEENKNKIILLEELKKLLKNTLGEGASGENTSKELKKFLKNTLGEDASEEKIKLKIYSINELFYYTSVYKSCLNALFPNLDENKILEYKTKYLFNLFMINKNNLQYKYFEIYENLKDTLKLKIGKFLKEKTESNFSEVKEAFKKYNKIFSNEINSNSSIQLIKLNSKVIKNIFQDTNNVLLPIDEILINIFIPQMLKITYNYYLTFKFVLNKLTPKEQQEFLEENSIIPCELFFTNDFIEEKKLDKISSFLKNLDDIEKTAKTLSMDKKFFTI